MICVSLSFNTLAVIPWSDPAENIGPILCMALTRQLKLFMEDLKEQLLHTSVKNVVLPELYFFYPEQLQHYVTLVYHPESSEQSLGMVIQKGYFFVFFIFLMAIRYIFDNRELP